MAWRDIYNVCSNCYTAHVHGNDPDDTWDGKFTDDSTAKTNWLGLLPSDRIEDATCGDHNGGEDKHCDYCDRLGWHSGYEVFSKDPCDGCGSTLYGERNTLLVWSD